MNAGDRVLAFVRGIGDVPAVVVAQTKSGNWTKVRLERDDSEEIITTSSCKPIGRTVKR